MKKLCIILLFVISALPVLAGEKEDSPVSMYGSVQSGASYDSQVSRSMSANRNTDTRDALAAFVDVLGGLTLYDFSFEYSTLVDYVPAYEALYSRFENELLVSWISEADTSEFTATLVLHHSARNFKSLDHYFGDATLYLDYYLEYNDFWSTVLTLTNGYAYHLDPLKRDGELSPNRLPYFNGPRFSFSFSEFFYPHEGMDFYRFSWQIAFSFYREATRDAFSDPPVANYLKSQNQIMENRLTYMSKYYFEYLSLALSFSYAHMYALKKDRWDTFEYNLRKRRIDHQFHLHTELSFPLIEGLFLDVSYDATKNISSLGTDELDYIDENFSRHVVRGAFRYEF